MATITSPRTESPGGVPHITSPSLASPTMSATHTPSSSSIDLPRIDPQATAPGTAAAATATAPVAQRRNRAALRDYYNLPKSKPSPQPASGDLSRTASIASNTTSDTNTTVTSSHLPSQTADGSGTSPLLLQLDDPSFEPLPFITTLLSTSSLRDILRTESALVSEIRTLDGERKALVYDNYSKLIKAVGTIGDMQRGMQKRSSGGDGGLDGVEGLRGRMEGLEGLVRTLGPEEKGEEGQEDVEVGQRRKRRRKQKDIVRWVLDGPGRIGGLLGEGKRDDAEMEWANLKRVLDQWEGVKGVEQLRIECQAVMNKASKRLADG